ncbi:MAG: nicotinate (nicotinamide) nucleotide adenylyltransferase [Candidatus Omnitrophota bacterium]
MKIGILGGTFNPPHLGHLVLGYMACEKLLLDKVLFVPTNIPPHKEDIVAGSSHRLNMLKLALDHYEKMEICDIEIKRGGISYTVDTIVQLKTMYPESEFYLIVGADLQKTLKTWKNWEKIEHEVKLVIANRDDVFPEISNNTIILDIPPINAASSKLREEIKFNTFKGQLIPQKVYEYIIKNGLYE